MSILSAKDIIDINKCFTLGINIFSFIINNAQNVSEIKDILGEEQLSNVKIFARLETQESLINFDSILNVVDGIILNHGFKFYNIQYKDVIFILYF
jgi:pyruvate kinase